MKTPKEWINSLNNKIITEDMLEAALYSYNKRAKNCRDQKRSYSHSYYRYADSITDKYEKQEEIYYDKKSKILSHLIPICIHKELVQYSKTRIYDYNKKFESTLIDAVCEGKIVWTNCYLDYDTYRQVWFFDKINFQQPIYQTYLYYKVGDHSFHQPIESITEKYSDLPLIMINRITTYGDDVLDLCSAQFADKVLNLIESNQCQIKYSATDPEIYAQLQEQEKAKDILNDDCQETLKKENAETSAENWDICIEEILKKDFQEKYKDKIASSKYLPEYKIKQYLKIYDEKQKNKK